MAIFNSYVKLPEGTRGYPCVKQFDKQVKDPTMRSRHRRPWRVTMPTKLLANVGFFVLVTRNMSIIWALICMCDSILL